MIFGGLCCLASMILLEVSESNTDSTAIAATWCAFAGKAQVIIILNFRLISGALNFKILISDCRAYDQKMRN